MPKGLRRAASAAAVVASAAVLAWAGLADPLCNWDLAGYTACALELRGTPESSLREETYRSLEGALPPEAYADMASSTPGRIARATDDASFLQHMPFYRARPVYTALLAGLTEAGLDPLQASSAISTAAALATLLLLLRLVPGGSTPGRTAAVAIGSLGAGLVEVARHATPDALAALCAVSVAALLLRGRRAAPAMFPLCVLVRTDLLLFVLPLCAFALARPAFPRVTTVLCAAVSIALAPLLHHLAGGYGWGTTFRCTFLEQAARPALMSGSVTPADYLAELAGCDPPRRDLGVPVRCRRGPRPVVGRPRPGFLARARRGCAIHADGGRPVGSASLPGLPGCLAPLLRGPVHDGAPSGGIPLPRSGAPARRRREMQPVTVTIPAIPRDLNEFSGLARLISATPQGAAALMVLALEAFTRDGALGSAMIGIACGGTDGDGGTGARMLPLVRMQLERQPFSPRSYFDGATPSNGYRLPDTPPAMTFTSNDYSGDEGSGRFKVFIRCSGADSPRPVTCKLREDGAWAALEWSSLLLGVRDPL
ncbi:MAG TPA: hypothetical protein P5266_00630 [Candidatus Fermentibacter sp.]|nr:hypothetical protein [Candidatus Fermentibacter sp.]